MRIITETGKLILWEFEPGDVETLAPIFADPEVMRFSLSGVKTRAQTKLWIAEARRDLPFSRWAVVRKEDNRLIGFCGLSRFDDVDGESEIEIGYRLARAEWGQGFGTEAAGAVRDYGFDVLQIPRLISIIEPANTASIRVAEKIGMRHEKDARVFEIPVRIYSIHQTDANAADDPAQMPKS